MKVANPFYKSREWMDLRDKTLKRDRYICQMCGVRCLGKKKDLPSPQVDHIETIRDRWDLRLTPSNLRVLCKPCHSKHTILGEIGKRKPEIGIDGYPVEFSA